MTSALFSLDLDDPGGVLVIEPRVQIRHWCRARDPPPRLC